MLLRRIQRIIEKNRNEVAGILLRRYPAFVWSDAPPARIPAFAFHSVTPNFLEPLLTYLAENQYTTLTADEYAERSAAGARGAEREVLLTFDDGHISLYRVAFPLLQRLGQKAVAYIVPGRTPADHAAEPATHAVCAWAHIREMHASGVVDFQSHSMFHHSIATSAQVIDFVRPGRGGSFLESDFAPLGLPVDGRGRIGPSAYGYPVHPWGARMGARPAFREDPRIAHECAAYVAAWGGADFFRRTGWKGRLTARLKEWRRAYPPPGLESPAEQREAMLQDLRDSKAAIEAQLPGKVVRHFCFPWFRGSSLAVELSALAGYRSNAWASLLPGFVPAGRRPWPIDRLPPRFIRRLPGQGRLPLGGIAISPWGTGASGKSPATMA
ncbi:MAG: polysaccharide deacetylase family protein [Lentisphaeria bacterium]|jgi:hypothetical protein|nr:polysaccharide deacetylase family protein [Lentisphaeria bacterium]